MKNFYLLLLLMSSAVWVNAQENYTLEYSYSSSESEGDVAICKRGYLNDTADVVIPSNVTYQGFEFKVIGIGSRAFDEDESSHRLRSISLPNTIESIGSSAFRECRNLSFIELPRNIDLIDVLAFGGCTYLKSAIIHCSGTFVLSDFFGSKGEHPLQRTGLNWIVYTNPHAPNNWVATTRTYVPDKEVYSSPYMSLSTTPHIIEMITFNENTFDYTGNVPHVTWKNNVEGYTATLDMPELKAEAGNHVDTVIATFTGEHPFVAKIPYKYTINPVKLTAKVSNASRQYGEDNPNFKLTYSGFLPGDNESVFTTQPKATTIATKTSGVGEYPITISGGSAKNYEIICEPGVLTITKAPLSAKVSDATKVYGSVNPAFELEYYGLKNGETQPAWTTRPTFQTEATQSSNVGEYAVKAVDGVPVNYELGSITAGKLIIGPAPLIIKANDAVRAYYDDNPNFSYTCNGFVNGDSESVLLTLPSLSTTANKTSNVGTYEVNVSGASSPNYSISYTNGTLSITPRTLVASVGNYERKYNEENPAFEVTYNGFVGNEDEKVLSSKATASTTATKSSNAGTYAIKVSGGSADNYIFSYTNGVLTINKAEQTIEWEQNFSDLQVGDQVELKAIASSGLPVTYSMDNTSIAEIYSEGTKYYLDCKTEGSSSIMAVQNGNENYYPSNRIRKLFNITIDGSAINDNYKSFIKIQRTLAGVKVTNVSQGDMIQVYSLDGVLQKSVKANGTTTDIQLAKDRVYIVKVGAKTLKFSL